MSLLPILLDISSDLGIDLSSPNEKALAIFRVNQAASEIYEANDLIGSLREEVFDPNVSTQQVALPFYVGQIRALRYYDSRQVISVEDIRARWNQGGGNETRYLKWRLITNKSPLKQNIDNESALMLILPKEEPECVTVNITGRTPLASRASETVTFCPGEKTQITTNIWKSVESIKKDSPTLYDITVADVDGVELSVIPNILLSPSYVILQVLDFEITNYFGIEVLYKMAYFPFKNDDDQFIVGHDTYDKAIYWKYLEHEAARSKDTEAALAARGKCEEIILQVMNNNEAGTVKPINFARSPYFNMYPNLYPHFGSLNRYRGQ